MSSWARMLVSTEEGELLYITTVTIFAHMRDHFLLHSNESCGTCVKPGEPCSMEICGSDECPVPSGDPCSTLSWNRLCVDTLFTLLKNIP